MSAGAPTVIAVLRGSICNQFLSLIQLKSVAVGSFAGAGPVSQRGQGDREQLR